jgi:putative membrane protein
MHALGGFWMVLFWLLVIVAAVFIVRAFMSSKPYGSSGTKGMTPLEVLKTRYASGEISREEYQRKLTDLKPPQGDTQWKT